MENDRSNIELVKERNDILDVVGGYVNLKQAGKNFTGLCPFHSEKTPSFSVSTDLQIYKCFGCGKTGDVIKFIEEIERVDFNEALEKLAKRAGIELKKSNKEINPIAQINSWASMHYQKQLYSPLGKQALEYLKNRGYSDSLIKEFEIGYAPGNTDFLIKLNGYKKFPKNILLESGVIIEKNGSLKEKYNKRVVFPIHSISGDVIAFTGRKLPGNDYGPKYLNSPESRIYKKRETLFNLNRAKGTIRKEDLCIVLEGQTDIIALYNAGYHNCIAPLGTSLTTEQLKLISNYTKNLLFIFDNDKAGQMALERAYLLATELGLHTYASNTGKYKDIDELIQDNKELLKDVVEKRGDAFTYLFTAKIEEIGTENLKNISILKSYAKTLLEPVSDETEKAYYNAKIKSIAPEVVLEQEKANINTVKTPISKKAVLDVEILYLKSLLSLPKIDIDEEITSEYFKRAKIGELIELIKSNNLHNVDLLKNEVAKHTELNKLFEYIMLSDIEIVDISDITVRVKRNYYENKLKEYRTVLAIAEEKEDTNKLNDLLEIVQAFSNKLKGIKK